MPHFSRLLLLCCLVFVGCEDAMTYRALPAPVAEAPVVNPPLSIRQQNWRHPTNGEGSCVHASLTSMLRWQNQFELAKAWRQKYIGGGEWSDELRRRLDAEGIPYAYTERANLQLLDDAHASRRGALLWWKPSHCCTFCGWVNGSDGKQYAVILDNNSPTNYEFYERSYFHRLWAGYGGFALSTLFDPPSPPIWKSYESNEVLSW